MKRDTFTTTEADAGAFERHHMADYDDRPTRSELAREAGPIDPPRGPVTADSPWEERHSAHLMAASTLMFDLIHAPVRLPADTVTNIDGLSASVVWLPGMPVDHPAVEWLQANPRWDVTVRGDSVYVRPAGGALEVGPPF